MAKFLLLGVDIPRTARLEGEISGVFDDDHVFGRKEDPRVWEAQGNDPADFPGIHYIVEVPGMPLAVAQAIAAKATEPWTRPMQAGDPGFDDPDMDDADKVVRRGRRRWRVELARMPGNIRNQLRRDRVLVVPYNRTVINNYFRDRDEAGEDFDS